MQAVYLSPGMEIDYTPSVAVDAGEVIVLGNQVAIANLDIAADELGALAVCGLFDGAKDDSVFAVGDAVYWDADGDPVTGTAGSGAFTADASLGPYAGECIAAAATGVDTVRFRLQSAPRTHQQTSKVVTVASAGSAQGDATALSEDCLNNVTGADGTKGVVLPTAAAGKRCRVYNAVATNGLKIYPATGDDINGGTTNAAITIEGKTYAILECVDATTWAAIYTANT